MTKTTVLTSPPDFEKAFARCCLNYSTLQLAAAWIGDPAAAIPYAYLDNLAQIESLIGVAFCQSHPEGIRLLARCSDLRIPFDEPLFHPKVYLFTRAGRCAALVGSSNLTYHGFARNIELNLLIEGDAEDDIFTELSRTLQQWRTDDYSFSPSEKWMHQYEKRYLSRRERMKSAGLDDEVDLDEKLSTTSAWLATASWAVFYRQVNNGLIAASTHPQALLARRLGFFEQVAHDLPLPWSTAIFEKLENRRLIGGMGRHGWLGHVAASGGFRRMLKNGTARQHQVICEAINEISALSSPLPWPELGRLLRRLIALGPSMKVWSRLLAITRPDLYCTISSPSVRKNLSKLLELPRSSFEEVEGYLHLLQLIHASPWFQSPLPIDPTEALIWHKRTAFIDAVFYEGRSPD